MSKGEPFNLMEAMRSDPALAERIYRANPELRPVQGTKAPARPVKMRMDGFGSDVEAAYAAELEVMRIAGEIIGWAKQPRFGLGDGRTYTPDFAIFRSFRVELVDVKGGHDWEDARIKLSWARDKYPNYTWRMVRGKRLRGRWTWADMKVGRGKAVKRKAVTDGDPTKI
jgi:hypothetical protein